MNPVDVEVNDVLEDVARVLRERETGRAQNYRSEVREVEDVVYLMPSAWQNISTSLLTLDQALSPLEGPASPEKPGPADRGAGVFKGALKRMIQKAVYWYVNPVVAQLHRMHSATARALREMADQLRVTSDRMEAMERDNLASRVNALEGERFDERIGRLERAWRQRATAEGALPEPYGAVAVAEYRPAGRDKARAASGAHFPQFQFDYYWFESIHRGDRALIKRRQQPYLEYFKECENVLDVGCGRGEFLELMAERGIKGYGIDIEDDAVQFCVDAGLEAVQAEGLEHLAGLADETLDGVFISQVVEHMTPGEITELVGLAYEKMKPGGFVVVETPNPQCLLIFASFFYADLSHVQPIHPETLRFLLLSAGFREVDVKLTNPVPRNQRLARVAVNDPGRDASWVEELNANVDKLNSVLFSHMDYAAVARK